jgi:hypothetical protein
VLAQEELEDVLRSVVSSVDAMAAFSHRLSVEFGANEVEDLAQETATTEDLRAGAGRSTC